MKKKQLSFREEHAEADVSLWHEIFVAAEVVLLHASPVYYGLGVPKGDGSGVVLLPGFLGSDFYMSTLYSWLKLIGYKPYFSGIKVNAHCPNLLIQHHISRTVDRAVKETRGKVHLIGHSLGGIIARSLAAQRPNDIASVITLGSPFRGTVAHHTILKAAEVIRQQILRSKPDVVLPECYTARCTCNFLTALKSVLPDPIFETAVCTEDDGVVDWRYCLTGDDLQDFKVSGTHIGLCFNPTVYDIIAERLSQAAQMCAPCSRAA